MSGKMEENGIAQCASSTSPTRPPLSSHHSNSVPTTPYTRDRKLSFNGRSPSPKSNGRNTSPRSVRSMAEPGFRSKAPSFAGCRYESGFGFSKRRIPYSVGGDPLERMKAPPKKFLSREQESKLTGDMRELYDRLLPSPESDERRAAFVKKLESILNKQWPGSEIKVHVFGSSGNLLCTNDSDVDICITTPMQALEKVCLLAQTLAEHGMERVVCVRFAKVPIVKFWDPELRLACDMNVNNTLALENTRMIKTYVEIDERVRPLAMIVKHWTKRRILNEAALGGTLSSYTWICMILNFLQTRNPPILPSLHKRPHMRKGSADSKIASFNDDLSQLRGHGNNNKESLGELLFNFFRRYAHDMDYEKHVVSVREGRLISKEAKKWHLMQNNRLCVEEPFNTDRNLGNTTDDSSFRGIHLELRRAFDLISEARLEECFEQYEFPANEEKVWEKPPVKPAPVLRSRSQSQSSRMSRAPFGHRGGRHGQYKPKDRRASSAAATNKYPLALNDIHSLRGREFLSRDQQAIHAQEQAMALHQHFMLEMHHLHEQEQRLRMLQAQTQQAQVRDAGERILPPQYIQREPLQRPTVGNPISLSTHLRPGQMYPPFVYPQVPGTPIHSVHTQPSSPSMKSAQPDLRRTLHRSSGIENNASGTRSHSQPARPGPMITSMQGAPPLPLNSQTFLQYQQQLRQQHQLYGHIDPAQSRLTRSEAMMYQDPSRMPMDFFSEDNVPKEYVGYWVNDAPAPYQYRDDPGASSTPPYHQDLYARARGMPPTIDRLRKNSRSPSPSTALPFRDRSHSIRSAASAPTGPSHLSIQNFNARAGPVIVNGTDGWSASDYLQPEYPSMVDSSSHTTISEATSGSEEQQYETPITAETEQAPNGFHYDDGPIQDTQKVHSPYSAAMSDSPRVPTFPRKPSAEPNRQRAPHQQSDVNTMQGTVRRLEKPSRTGGGIAIQFGDHEITAPSAKSENKNQQQNRSASSTSKGEPGPSTPKNGQFDKPLIPVPLLSPVREVRTPSPLGMRAEEAQTSAQRGLHRPQGKMDLHIPTFAELVRAKQERQEKQKNGAVAQNSSKAPPLSRLAETMKAQNDSPPPDRTTATVPQSSNGPSLSNVPPPSAYPGLTNKVQPIQTNGWQQQSSKKSKRNSRSRPISGHYPSTGEPLPANESERKGG